MVAARLRAPISSASQLTGDDSWCNDILAKGALTHEQAKHHKYAHAIVNSLADRPTRTSSSPTFATSRCRRTPAPHLLRRPLELCGDARGARRPGVRQRRRRRNLPRARSLANHEGGHDNISAVLLRLPTAKTGRTRGVPSPCGGSRECGTSMEYVTVISRSDFDAVAAPDSHGNDRLASIVNGSS